MTKRTRVKGNIIEKTGGISKVFAKEGIEHNSEGHIDYFAQEYTHEDPEQYTPKQAENSVNVYVGMFFDGTGNNRHNSDTTYYSKIKGNGDKINAKDIPSDFLHTKTIKTKDNSEKQVKVKITDRDSYWNPYSNVAKLFDLYKEKKKSNKDDIYPEYGEYSILKQYVEGIGTKQDEGDDILGSGLARGSWGVLKRVEEGIEKLITDQFVNIPKDKKINKIVFDVFGFSRGATAARHFCNEVLKKAETKLEQKRVPGDRIPIYTGKTYISQHAGGILGNKLKEEGCIPVGETFVIEVRFLGLFDTVVSDMITKDNMGYKLGLGGVLIPLLSLAPLGQEALQDIKTNLSGLNIGKVFHIKAQTEWRKNFAFTPSEQGYTLEMLGSHSDIGGGYAELDKHEPALSFFDVPQNSAGTLTDMQKFKEFYVNQYLCTNDALQFINTYDHVTETTITPNAKGPGIYSRDIEAPSDFPDNGTAISKNPSHQIYQTKESDHYVLQDSRYISNKYSLVSMYLMLEKAIENKVPFYNDYNIAPDVKKKFEYEIPQTEEFKILTDYLELMKKISKEENKDQNSSYEIPFEMYRHICNKYIHLSAHFGGLKNDFITVKTGDHHILESVVFVNQPVAPTIADNKVTYQREIYYNK
ncbi:hypothetical protein GON26_17320 [Flavobacterium sp. GA093]|uniref:T6SS Phospholipase effector Tle1-like catalytic domain-containing protein n=1 Tax=Flavobacterium hydrocarbonoxydans TaxID=2683249 RepID=A0A6I4NUF5_9FLAO|nr:DUF2235 domain-containing protein [Flavobacterium hydrocarbonoxydans]MWB96125.1 hypothetical protein [Flavobacterium hydrocarbonoxydans]